MPPEKESSVPEEKKKNTKCSKTVMGIIFRHWPELEVCENSRFYTNFLLFSPFGMTSYLYQVHARTDRHTHAH